MHSLKVACLIAILLMSRAVAAQTPMVLTCEQVYAVAQASVRYRDQGYPLARVLESLQDVEKQNRLDEPQMQVLRSAVSAAYLGHATPEEIGLLCVQNR